MLGTMSKLIALAIAFAFATSLDAQTTWTLRNQTSALGDYLWSITEGNFGAVAVGDAGKILHSQDGGRTWTQRASGTNGWIVAVTYGNGRYVAVGEGGLILLSSDGVVWTRAAITGTSARLNGVVYGQGRFVAVGEGGAIVVSQDGGNTWSPTTSNAGSVWLHGIAYGGARWVATGQTGIIISSPDGITWTRQASVGEDLEAVVLAESSTYQSGTRTITYAHFLAIGQNARPLLMTVTTFADPGAMPALAGFTLHWPQKPATTARMRSLTVGNKVLIATGENGSVYSSPSQYGPWERLSIGTDRNLVGAGFVGGSLTLVGESRSVYQSEPIYVSRLGNISTRGMAGTDANAMIAGTVIAGTVPKQVLVRGIGPALGQFGVPNVISDPVLSVYDSAGRLVATNTRWSTNLNANAIAAASTNSGAFSLPPASRDSALLLTLTPGAYTFQLTNATGTAGNALVEAYDLEPLGASNARTLNISTRGFVGTGDNILIAGLVVQGKSSRTLLVRGIGPSLTSFGVTNALADPVVRIVGEGGTVLATNDNWAETTLTNGRAIDADEVRAATAATGAFPLTAGSRDAALLVTLVPGNYSLQVSGAGSTTGIALVEAYDVPGN